MLTHRQGFTAQLTREAKETKMCVPLQKGLVSLLYVATANNPSYAILLYYSQHSCTTNTQRDAARSPSQGPCLLGR